MKRLGSLRLLAIAAGYLSLGACSDLKHGAEEEVRRALYEIPYVLSDDGSGVVLIVPDCEGVDSVLLALARDHAVPAAECDAAGSSSEQAMPI